MKKLIAAILQQHQFEGEFSFQAIRGLGIVNQVFELKHGDESYILRLNERAKQVEYQKEHWCLNKVASLGIPTAKVIARAVMADHVYMIQQKIPGQNGQMGSPAQQAMIWRELGTYAAKFHQIDRIEVEEVEQAEFHENWFARLTYNINQLKPQDSLLKEGTFKPSEYQNLSSALKRLLAKDFQSGLVHGDLCPRNVIVQGQKVSLIDWGTAEINIVPHNEIGLLLMSEEASKEEFQLFLVGMGISPSQYDQMEEDILLINLLHQLDKYRWAETYDFAHLSDYANKVRTAFEVVMSRYP